MREPSQDISTIITITVVVLLNHRKTSGINEITNELSNYDWQHMEGAGAYINDTGNVREEEVNNELQN